MAKQELTDFTLPKTAYAAFDAESLKSLIKQRLNENSYFTGQNFEGSNLSSMMDIIAYSYHTLLFYLNQTATESMFSEAELYENMNRIVKSLDYKPVGHQTSALTFDATATSDLSPSTYTIPRYSFFNIGGIHYTFTEDVTFTKTDAGTQNLTSLAERYILHQGKFVEYPLITSIGEEYETFVLLPGDDLTVDHFNIHVYVKDIDTQKWTEWNRTTSLFLERSTASTYEVRLNENKRYELKFGNGRTGKKLKAGDQVAVYYLLSDGSAGAVGPGAINRSRLGTYDTVQFTDIYTYVKDKNIQYATQNQLALVQFSNVNSSSEYYTGETVEEIRTRAHKVFATQYRLVTKSDHENYLLQTYSNIIRDTKVVNNWDYLDGHFKYNVDTLKLSRSNIEPRTLLNQVNFADSCDFNNLYCYVVPKIEQITTGVARANYLTPSQKNLIVSGLRENKTLTTELLVMDPIYIAADIGIPAVGQAPSVGVKDESILKVFRNSSSTRSFESIQNAVNGIIVNYFKQFKLGESLSISNMVTDILNLDGVSKIATQRKDGMHQLEGMNLLLWNPIFPEQDIITAGADVSMPYYKYPFLNDATAFINKIVVESESALTGPGSSEY